MGVKIAFNVKNSSKVFKPSSTDVLLYDGKDWYVTSKEKLFEEENKLIDQLKLEVEKLKKENQEFKVEIAKQMLSLSEIIEKMYKNNSEVE